MSFTGVSFHTCIVVYERLVKVFQRLVNDDQFVPPKACKRLRLPPKLVSDDSCMLPKASFHDPRTPRKALKRPRVPPKACEQRHHLPQKACEQRFTYASKGLETITSATKGL